MSPASEARIRVEMDVVRINYECADSGCDGAYTEKQYSREVTPVCGMCGGQLDKVTLVVARREPT